MLWLRVRSLGFILLAFSKGFVLACASLFVPRFFFFLGFFWAYLHCSLSPNVELGSSWPPLGITPLDAYTLPLLNTILLLSSGAVVTWSHSALLQGIVSRCVQPLGLSIFLGFFFLMLQGVEYFHCSFCISDSSYGSCFFLATGFHGLHVLLGSLFLLFCFSRLLLGHFSPKRHLGLAFAIWYWHFVDVVWLLLFFLIYV